jgi:hypothetical protein
VQRPRRARVRSDEGAAHAEVAAGAAQLAHRRPHVLHRNRGDAGEAAAVGEAVVGEPVVVDAAARLGEGGILDRFEEEADRRIEDGDVDALGVHVDEARRGSLPPGISSLYRTPLPMSSNGRPAMPTPTMPNGNSGAPSRCTSSWRVSSFQITWNPFARCDAGSSRCHRSAGSMTCPSASMVFILFSQSSHGETEKTEQETNSEHAPLLRVSV